MRKIKMATLLQLIDRAEKYNKLARLLGDKPLMIWIEPATQYNNDMSEFYLGKESDIKTAPLAWGFLSKTGDLESGSDDTDDDKLFEKFAAQFAELLNRKNDIKISLLNKITELDSVNLY